MEQEKEVRFLVDDVVWKGAQALTTPLKQKVNMTDITCGLYGFESLSKTGTIFRVRQKPNKISLEIKKRTNSSDWFEESIMLESVKKGLSFLNLAGLKPYLYISREREVRSFKGLKVFFDNVELVGKFIEIEYQDSTNSEVELSEFIKLAKIKNVPQPLYGDIIKQKLETDDKFKTKFNEKLESLLK